MEVILTSNPMPSLEKAKELCKFYKRPLQNSVILLNSVAPMVKESGIFITKDLQTEMQRDMNRNGMLVVTSPFKREATDESNPTAVFEGERVLFKPNAQAYFMTTITTTELLEGLKLREGETPRPEMYKTYVVMCMPSFELTCVLEG